MKHDIKQKLGRIVIAVIILTLITLVIAISRVNATLSSELAKPHFGMLSSDERRMIVHDLETRDPALLQSWIDYFRHTLELEAHIKSTKQGLDDVYALYKQYEQPGRSNYFYDLVSCLSLIQNADGLRENTLTNYIGKPDKLFLSEGKEILLYNFTSFGGRKSVAIISATNGVVSAFDLSFGQSSAATGGKL